MHLQQMTLVNTVAKEVIAHHKEFLFLPQYFLSGLLQFYRFRENIFQVVCCRLAVFCYNIICRKGDAEYLNEWLKETTLIRLFQVQADLDLLLLYSHKRELCFTPL